MVAQFQYKIVKLNMYLFIKNNAFQFLLSYIIVITGITSIWLLLNATEVSITSGTYIITTGISGLLIALSLQHFKNGIFNKTKSLSEKRQRMLLLELDTLRKEKAVITKELDFFKSQFNAHILFNFLNFCYSKVHKNSESAAEAVEVFSEMLRYTLQMKPDKPVSLKKEIEYIENYIIIQKCLTNTVCVDFKYEGAISKKQILPGILVTFVENAFNYGEINNEMHPIAIYLSAASHQVIFRVKNKKNTTKQIKTLDSNHRSVRDILDYFYGEDYQLNIQETDQDFSLELIL